MDPAPTSFVKFTPYHSPGRKGWTEGHRQRQGGAEGGRACQAGILIKEASSQPRPSASSQRGARGTKGVKVWRHSQGPAERLGPSPTLCTTESSPLGLQVLTACHPKGGRVSTGRRRAQGPGRVADKVAHFHCKSLHLRFIPLHLFEAG